ncbi:unnamed protein product, partial [Notodromas monacha]
MENNRRWTADSVGKASPLSSGNVRYAEEVMETVRGKMEDAKQELMNQVEEQLQDLISDCFEEIRSRLLIAAKTSPSTCQENENYFSDLREKDEKPSRKNVDSEDFLPPKQFVLRDSVLTDLFRVSHIRTIYHIFTATLLLIVVQAVFSEISERGSLDLRFEMVWWTFGKFSSVMLIWMSMFSATCALFVVFSFWASQPALQTSVWRLAFFVAFLHYLGAFLYYPVSYLLDHDLPVASSFIVLMEQTRLLMKSYAFVRYNASKVSSWYESKDRTSTLTEKTNIEPSGSVEHGPGLDFSCFLYFLFAPTLVYRDSYPQTKKIRWSYVFSNFMQVFGVIVALYFVLTREIFPLLKDSNGVQQLSVAKLMHFGFKSDWWNSTSYTRYYRKWNIVVHDWLYEYIYRDVYALRLNPFNLGRRFVPTVVVFFVSALFHEYILSFACSWIHVPAEVKKFEELIFRAVEHFFVDESHAGLWTPDHHIFHGVSRSEFISCDDIGSGTIILLSPLPRSHFLYEEMFESDTAKCRKKSISLEIVMGEPEVECREFERELEKIRQRRLHHIGEYEALMKLPAPDVDVFHRDREVRAATKIQSVWRGRYVRKQYSPLLLEQEQLKTRSAKKLQKFFKARVLDPRRKAAFEFRFNDDFVSEAEKQTRDQPSIHRTIEYIQDELKQEPEIIRNVSDINQRVNAAFSAMDMCEDRMRKLKRLQSDLSCATKTLRMIAENPQKFPDEKSARWLRSGSQVFHNVAKLENDKVVRSMMRRFGLFDRVIKDMTGGQD